MWRKSERLQRLRARVKKTRTHFRAKAFAFPVGTDVPGGPQQRIKAAQNGRSRTYLASEIKPALQDSKSSCSLRLPRVLARLGAQHNKSTFDLSCSALQRGNAGEFQEGTSWRLFFRHFFATRQRNGIRADRERVPQAQCERPAPNSLKNLTKPLKISPLPIDFSTLLC